MAAVKTKLGRIPCEGCGHPTVVKENEQGTLTMQCDECDQSVFAKRGTAAQARWRAALAKAGVLPGTHAPESAPKAAAPAVPKPAKKPAAAQAPESVPKAPAKAGPFDFLGNL